MKIPRKTDPIDDLINELLKPIKLLRELKKVKQENAQLKYTIEGMHSYYAHPIELEDQIINLQKRNEYLEAMVKFYEAKSNATS